MKQILVIDDLRSFRVQPEDAEVTIARTGREGLAVLAENRQWDEIWLDHDLGLDQFGIPDTIMDCVDYMAERAFNGEPVAVVQVLVHSSNPPGVRQMLSTLNHFGYDAKAVQPERFFVV